MMVFAYALLACANRESRPVPAPTASDSGDTGDTSTAVEDTGQDTATFDGCAGLLGAPLDTPEVFSADVRTTVPMGSVEVIGSQAALDEFWTDNHLTISQPVLDFSMAQLVVLQEAYAACWESNEAMSAFYAAASGDGIVGAVQQSVSGCDGSCDTGGSPVVTGWQTPIGAVTLCRFGVRCE